MAEKAGDAKKAQQGCLGCLGLLVVIGAIALVGSFLGGDDEDDSAEGHDLRYAAFDVCTQFVKERLLSPRSAEFSNEFEDDGEVVMTPDTADPEVWTVVSHVDSENGFGALLRSNFTCQVRHVRGDQWELVDLNLIEG